MTGIPEILCPAPEHHRATVYEIYMQAFWPKIRFAMTDRERADRVLRPSLRLDRALVAVDGQDVLGVAGFHHDGGLFDAGLAELRRVYGLIGSLWRGALLALLERREHPGTLLMDGIAVAASARGRGVGTALLNAIETRARTEGCARIRLDVIDGNAGARRLYERRGFTVTEHERFAWLNPILGFSGSTTMTKILKKEAS